MPWILSFTLIVFAPVIAIYFYLGKKILNALVELKKWDRKFVRSVIATICIACNFLPIVFLFGYLIVGRSVSVAFSGDNVLIDVFFVYPFWIALVIAVQLFLVFILIDAGRFAFSFFIKKSEENKRRGAIVTIVSLLFICVYSGAVIFKDTWTVRVAEREITLPSDFSSLDGIRIAQISDVQGDGRTTERMLQDYVSRVNALQPDFIYFAGDVVTGGERYIESTTSILGNLRSKFGTIAAVGDHDFFSNKTKVVDGLRRNGILVVEDSTIYFTVNASQLAITGITYTYRARPSAEQLDNATDGSHTAYRILLVHQPAMPLVAYAAERHYNLLVAGHTHGGGIAFGIPGLFLFAPASIETRYLSGLYKVDEMMVSVTNGLGFTLAPIRFHAPAEITMLKLTKER